MWVTNTEYQIDSNVNIHKNNNKLRNVETHTKTNNKSTHKCAVQYSEMQYQ